MSASLRLPSASFDPSPLLSRGAGVGAGGGRWPSLRGAVRFLRRVGSRRAMREPSVLVREAAAEQLDERQSDWAYSRPVVALDMLWNLAFVVAAVGVLALSSRESPTVPLRAWIVGYALQCVLHIVCVLVEYRRRHREGQLMRGDNNSNSSSSGVLIRDLERGSGNAGQNDEENSVIKHLESANTMFSFLWWIVGFYWVSAGGQDLTHNAPQLYWLSIVFLAFDVFFVVFCVALACIIGIAVCCCLPCIIAILYAVVDQDGASDEDIRRLRKYKFHSVGYTSDLHGDAKSLGGTMSEIGVDQPVEHTLSADDAECCICLSPYDDGAELRELPCCHHFHAACVDKWLYINATCPLCKYNIIKVSNHSEEDV